MLVLNLPFKALMFLTLMRPSLVLFLVLWLKLVKDLDRKSGSAGMPRPISYAVFCLKKKTGIYCVALVCGRVLLALSASAGPPAAVLVLVAVGAFIAIHARA